MYLVSALWLVFGLKIFLHPQVGKKGHSSVEDAAASMELYKLVEVKWEKMLSVKPADMFTTKTG